MLLRFAKSAVDLWRAKCKIALDVGTANSLVYSDGKIFLVPDKRVLRNSNGNGRPADQQPSLIPIHSAVARRTSNFELHAIGQDAYEMMGREPKTIQVVRPIVRGRVEDNEAFVEIVLHLIRQVIPTFRVPQWGLADILLVIPVPCNTTRLERDAVKSLVKERLKAESVLIFQPIAAGIGAGLEFENATAVTIIDGGGGTTDIAVLALSEVAYHTSIEIGGHIFDEDIIRFVQKRGLRIGNRTAEEIKRNLASATGFEELVTQDVRGQDLRTGQPRTLRLDSEQIYRCLRPRHHQLARDIKIKLQETSGEIPGDIRQTGIKLTGGHFRTHGSAKFLCESTGLSISHVENVDPLLTVVKGAGKIMDDPALLAKFDLSKKP